MAARRGKSSTRVRRGDLTRPTPRQERLLPKRLGYLVLTMAAILVMGSFANSFLVLPVKSWFGQRSEFEDRNLELDALRKATDRLRIEVERLQTPTGIENAARQELGFVMIGEKRRTVIGLVEAPISLPYGWPYDLVGQIVQVREAEARAAATDATG